ncbi:helix-turn-helix domain-containing protein [Micromonospora sp. CPCC 206061]|uniref:helix-turn-helix domain-containing protein n=1 Tax=Micromonospora sp. CPCC 206061 TaxID=3122410 RepID=UPI002FF34C3A
MINPERMAAAQRALGAQLARLREAAGLKQVELAARILTSRSTVANIETGHTRGTQDFWTRVDEELGAGGELLRGHAEIVALIRRQREDEARSAAAARATTLTQVTPTATTPPGSRAVLRHPVGSLLDGGLAAPPRRPDTSGMLLALAAPAGRFFDGLTIEARVYPAVDDGRILAAVPPGYIDDQFLRRAKRGLVVGVTDSISGVQAFGLDARQARRRLARGAATARLLIPRANALDDLTFGILWAVANMDQALLNDDRLIADLQPDLSPYTTVARSSLGRDVAADLSSVSQMWIGSEFCARHILDRLGEMADVPDFWTREQRGEEASTWLLFAHKYTYLQAVAERFAGQSINRAFCLPPDTVDASPPAERLLLLLAAALMESFGITVTVCTEPEYANIEGFVLEHQRRAIVANWIGTDGIWHVDVTTDRPSVGDYGDVIGHARSRSAVAGPSSVNRLQALADYLRLDWPWLVRRCAELGEQGCAGVAEPRSRLLSVAGVDRACQYLGRHATGDG